MNFLYLFHIHTYRCNHADNIPEEEYVRKAIRLGYKEMYFSDHAPFPQNPFTNCMKYEELNDYISVINELKHKYKEDIAIYSGLEVDYLHEYEDYYYELQNKMDFLLLGQHRFVKDGKYNFELSREEVFRYERDALGQLIIEGINTGLFQYVAHPDRIFRHKSTWSSNNQNLADKIIKAALSRNVKLEQNQRSKKRENCYFEWFWKNVPEDMIIQGVDAHSINDF